MKLADFLSAARACGMTTLRVESPRGYTLLRGGLLEAEDVEARCSEDAQSLAGETRHEYIAVVESPSGNMDRFTVRVLGGKRESAEHTPDPKEIQNAGQAIGHLVRMLSDSQKQIISLSSIMATGETNAFKELRRLRAVNVQVSEVELQRDIIRYEQGKEAKGSEGTQKLLGEGLAFLKLAASKAHPGAAGATLDSFRASLHEAQLDQLDALLGPKIVRALLAATTPARFVDVCMGVPKEQFTAILGVLTDEQRALLTGAIGPEYEARAKKAAAEDVAAPAAPPPTANGAAS